MMIIIKVIIVITIIIIIIIIRRESCFHGQRTGCLARSHAYSWACSREARRAIEDACRSKRCFGHAWVKRCFSTNHGFPAENINFALGLMAYLKVLYRSVLI